MIEHLALPQHYLRVALQNNGYEKLYEDQIDDKDVAQEEKHAIGHATTSNGLVLVWLIVEVLRTVHALIENLIPPEEWSHDIIPRITCSYNKEGHESIAETLKVQMIILHANPLHISEGYHAYDWVHIDDKH